MGTLTKKTQISTINFPVIMVKYYPKKFAILHMVGGVEIATKSCFYKSMLVNINPVMDIKSMKLFKLHAVREEVSN